MNGAYSHIEGAMYRATDTMFLLNGSQIYNMVQNLGTIKVEPTDKAKDELYEYLEIEQSDYPNGIQKQQYWWALAMQGYDQPSFICYADNSGDGSEIVSYWPANAKDRGVRPAFYLNENNAIIKSGEGSKENPYILDGKEETITPVFCNGGQLRFDEQPVYEEDRLLVPVRTIFEELGAEVNWDEENQIITASTEESNIVMQINNAELGNGKEVITLDVPPRLIGDRTMVPLRAVSKSLGAVVRYIKDLDRVSIDKPKLPMDFGEGVGVENWQQDPELRKRMETDDWYPSGNFSKEPRYWEKYCEE